MILPIDMHVDMLRALLQTRLRDVARSARQHGVARSCRARESDYGPTTRALITNLFAVHGDHGMLAVLHLLLHRRAAPRL